MADKKVMTPKKGLTLGKFGKSFRHGDELPPAVVEEMKPENIEELKSPKMMLKKGLALKVDNTEYKEGELIKDEHLTEINPQFLEPWMKGSETKPETKDKLSYDVPTT